jgi:phospholipid/cholesterol/gamma-HCH transport system ATP-binding protein
MIGIQARNIALALGQRTILRDVSLTVASGKSLVLMGQSGVGKSVLLRCLLGLLPRHKGIVQMGALTMDVDSQLPPISFFQQTGVVFQSYALFDSLTVWENVAFRTPGSDRARRDHAAQLLHRVEIPSGTMDLYPSALSGGMKRRVSIARAIALSPTYLFFDEPTEGLDPILSHTISHLIRKVITQLKATAITISHDIHSAMQIGDHIALLDDGALAWHGKCNELHRTTHPIMRQFVECTRTHTIGVNPGHP